MKLVDEVKQTMGPIEKLSALKLWWWVQREGPNLFKQWMQNAKVAWVVSLIGALTVSFAGACAAGAEVFSHETCVSILLVTNFINGALNIVGAGPRGVVLPKA